VDDQEFGGEPRLAFALFQTVAFAVISRMWTWVSEPGPAARRSAVPIRELGPFLERKLLVTQGGARS